MTYISSRCIFFGSTACMLSPITQWWSTWGSIPNEDFFFPKMLEISPLVFVLLYHNVYKQARVLRVITIPYCVVRWVSWGWLSYHTVYTRTHGCLGAWFTLTFPHYGEKWRTIRSSGGMFARRCIEKTTTKKLARYCKLLAYLLAFE